MAEKQYYDFIRDYCQGKGQKFAGLACHYYEAIEQICLLLQKRDIETLWREGRCTWDMVYSSLEACLHILKGKKEFSYLPLDEAEEAFDFQSILERLLHYLGEKRASEIQQKGLAALPGWKGFIRKTVYTELKRIAIDKHYKKYDGKTFISVNNEAVPQEALSEEVSERMVESVANYQLTEETFERLKSEALPGETLNALEPFIGREFLGHDEFVEALVERIGAEAADQYRDLLLKHAEKKKSVSQYSIELLKERAKQEDLTPKRKEKYERQLHLFREMVRLLSTFKFHEEAFQKLLKDGVPESVLQQLNVLQHIQYHDQHSFLETIERILGEESTSRYAKRVLNRAGYSEKQAKRELAEIFYDGQDRQLRRDWEEIREYLQEKMSATDAE